MNDDDLALVQAVGPERAAAAKAASTMNSQTSMSSRTSFGSITHDEVKRTMRERDQQSQDRMFQLMGLLYKPHPWHGIDMGPEKPRVVTAYVECVPGEGIKYEVDKATGYLMVDRPHKFSSVCPTIYGFLPRTYCGEKVAERCMERTGLENIKGDEDPIDICILSTRAIHHGDILVKCKPIGGVRMIDKGEADDKIIAVISGDATMNDWNDISDIPQTYVEMIRHYFLTYKQSPTEKEVVVQIPELYGVEEAHEMIRRSSADYEDKYRGLKSEFAKSILSGLKRQLAASLLDTDDI